jgi:hypothetical protein
MAETPEHRAWIEEFINRSATMFRNRHRIMLKGVKGHLVFYFPTLDEYSRILVKFELYHFEHDINVFIGEFQRTPQFFNELSQKLANFDFGEHTDLRPDDLMMEELLTTDIEFDEHECYVCTNGTSNNLPCGHIICKTCLYKQLTNNPHQQFACGVCRQQMRYSESRRNFVFEQDQESDDEDGVYLIQD